MAVNAFSNPQFSVDATGSMKPSLNGANALTPKEAVQAKTKTAPQILRYPLKQLEGSTDYLLIKVVKYQPPGFATQGGSNNISLQTGTQALQRNIESPLSYINLPIPGGIEDGNSVNWGDDNGGINSIEAYGVKAIGNILQNPDAAKALAEEFKKIPGIAEKLSVSGAQDIVQQYFAGKLVNSLGGNVSTAGLLSRATGQVLNPNLELLFSGVNLRDFRFTFDFAPREPAESQMVKDIIRTFKKSMAPKTTNASGQSLGAGLFISAPDVFQLTFKTGNQDHPFLYKMKPCALVNMGVNYTASGPYATYADATPVHMQMTLQFSELNPIYAEDYNGVGGVGY